MSSLKTHAEKTSAADKRIGFEYQYYYFLLKALNLKVGQSVGLEIKDDVHTELGQSINIFYQLKHTTQLNAAAEPIALTRLDKDMWKTLYNWSMVIKDEQAGRKELQSQIDFIKKSEFHLVSNKTKSKSNTFFDAINNLQLHLVDISEVRTEIESILASTTDKDIQKYIKEVLLLEQAALDNFLRLIHFELEVDDVLTLIRQSILELHVEQDKVQGVLEGIDSNLREHNYNSIKNGIPVVLTFQDFHTKCRKFIQDGRSTKLTHKAFTPALPIDLFSQLFIKRLIEIQAIEPSEAEYAAELTTLKLQLAWHLEHWEQSGEVTTQDTQKLHQEVTLAWQNGFRYSYLGCVDEEIENKGRAILQDLLSKRFQLNDESLHLSHSNGEVYLLSDDGHIGWHKNWRTK